MINNPRSLPITSGMTVHRMRERGPIESYKIGKLNKDSTKDIEVLEKHFNSSYNTLKEYISETHNGCDKELVICEGGEQRFSGVCSVTNDIINNKKNNLLISSRGVKK